jgi:hypothetical protein
MKILLLLPDDLLRFKISRKSIDGVSQERLCDIGGLICVTSAMDMDGETGLGFRHERKLELHFQA